MRPAYSLRAYGEEGNPCATDPLRPMSATMAFTEHRNIQDVDAVHFDTRDVSAADKNKRNFIML